jgi:hypothetical protein
MQAEFCSGSRNYRSDEFPHAQMQRTQTVRAVVERKSTVYGFEKHAQTTGQEI